MFILYLSKISSIILFRYIHMDTNYLNKNITCTMCLFKSALTRNKGFIDCLCGLFHSSRSRAKMSSSFSVMLLTKPSGVFSQYSLFFWCWHNLRLFLRIAYATVYKTVIRISNEMKTQNFIQFNKLSHILNIRSNLLAFLCIFEDFQNLDFLICLIGW